jgi:hypothetical protein
MRWRLVGEEVGLEGVELVLKRHVGPPIVRRVIAR